MKLKIQESAEIVNVKPNQDLSPNDIREVLYKARRQYLYAKFITNGCYIQVTFIKDGTISVASNIRSSVFMNDFRRYERSGWTFPIVQNFVYKWMTLQRAWLY